MRKLNALIAAAALVLAASAHAQDCSGGKDGGMDATGNECNQPVAPATQPPVEYVSARPAIAAARQPTTPVRMANNSAGVARVTTPQGR